MSASGIDISKFDNEEFSASISELKKNEAKKTEKRDFDKKKLTVKKTDEEGEESQTSGEKESQTPANNSNDQGKDLKPTNKFAGKKPSDRDPKKNFKTSPKPETKKDEVKVLTKKPTKKTPQK